MLQHIQPGRFGCGIAVRGPDLVAVAIRLRRGGVRVLGRTELRGFRERTPAQWGAEYSDFVRGLGVGHVAASLCVPREEVVFRTVRLPPMRTGELARAVALHVDDLHPYGEGPVCHDSAPLGPEQSGPRRRPVAVAIVEADRIAAYSRMFAEAGVLLAACTVSASALRAAVRLGGNEPRRPFAVAVQSGTSLEIYGESADCPSLSSALDLGGMTLRGAMRLAFDGLRPRRGDTVGFALLGGELDDPIPGFVSRPVDSILGSPTDFPEGFSLARDAVALGAAIESARPKEGLGLNLLPPAARRSNSVAPFAPRLALAFALVLAGGAFLARPLIQDSRYADRLREETARLEGGAAISATDPAYLSELRQRYRWLLGRQERARSDLELLREIAEILPPATVLSALQFDDAKSVLTGTAKNADPLLAILAASPLLDDARFTRSPSVDGDGELFQIEAQRTR